MTLYLDTSALVKLYVEEIGSPDVAGLVRHARLVVTSRVAYPEARAALARRQREGAIRQGDLRRAVTALDHDINAMFVVELTASVARHAGDLAGRRRLRGFEAIHLASALEFGRTAGRAPRLLAFDDRLSRAALAEGLLPP